MSDSSQVIKYVAIVSLVAIFCLFLVDWDDSAPTVAGWGNLQATLSDDPETGFPEPGTVNPPVVADCAWWDVACYTGNLAGSVLYIGGLMFVTVGWILAVMGWFFLLVWNLFAALFGSVTLTTAGMPTEVQILLWVFIAPFAVMLLLFIIRLVRGSEG
jgi:hypothetical protein